MKVAKGIERLAERQPEVAVRAGRPSAATSGLAATCRIVIPLARTNRPSEHEREHGDVGGDEDDHAAR